jgi:site-specific recombinase XerD
MQQVVPLKTDHTLSLELLLEQWRVSLQEQDRSSGTVKKYTQAISRFLAWYETEEQAPLTLQTITPMALIGYRNELQLEQRKSTSTINLQISALRAWCGWMTDQGYLATDPAARVKLVGAQEESKREGLSCTQINALLRQAQLSRESERNYAILQVLLQTGIRLSECSSLAFADITFGERSGMLRVHKGKGNKVRSVPLNASARAAIAAYVAPRLSIEKPSLKTVAAKWPRPTSAEALAPLWLSQKGGKLSTSAMGQNCGSVKKAESFPRRQWGR